MSAWGANLFDDDLAADLRGLFRELLRRGNNIAEATDTLCEAFSEVMGTEEEGVFWLAIAATQWEYGALQPNIQQRALQVIADGTDLALWKDDPKFQVKRQTILVALAERLKAANPKPKKLPRKKPPPPECEWEPGDMIAYQLPSGNQLLLRVVHVQRYLIHDVPTCELLDWVGADLPDSTAISKLPIRRNKRYPSESMFAFPMVKKHLSRCRTLNLRLPPTMRYDGSYVLPLEFDSLPTEMEEYFELSVVDIPR